MADNFRVPALPDTCDVASFGLADNWANGIDDRLRFVDLYVVSASFDHEVRAVGRELCLLLLHLVPLAVHGFGQVSWKVNFIGAVGKHNQTGPTDRDARRRGNPMGNVICIARIIYVVAAPSFLASGGKRSSWSGCEESTSTMPTTSDGYRLANIRASIPPRGCPPARTAL